MKFLVLIALIAVAAAAPQGDKISSNSEKNADGSYTLADFSGYKFGNQRPKQPYGRVAYAAPAPVQIPAAPVHVVPHAIENRVHYAETPVVVGHTSHIMKPNLGAGAHVTNFDFMGLAQTKTAPQESIVQKPKVLAPARSVSEITPQVTVQHPTKVNIEKVSLAVTAPYEVEYDFPDAVSAPAPAPVHQMGEPAIVLLTV